MSNIISSDGTIVGQEYDDRYSGEGVCYRDDGSQYTGEWKDGRMHGIGTYRGNDGKILEGVFLNGSYLGMVKIIKDGTLRKIRKIEDIFSNDVEILYPNNDVYKGSWYHTGKNGYGTLKHERTAPQSGFFVNDKFIGQLYGINADGSFYKINYKNCIFEGTVHIDYENGDVYEGHWKDGYRTGYGELTTITESGQSEKYFGTWNNDLKDGYRGCHQQFADGTLYEGGFKNNL